MGSGGSGSVPQPMYLCALALGELCVTAGCAVSCSGVLALQM